MVANYFANQEQVTFIFANYSLPPISCGDDITSRGYKSAINPLVSKPIHPQQLGV
jgi:hypothetical protein